jgi:ABC-type branched-subunit amino acid transport system substrate-binding protein
VIGAILSTSGLYAPLGEPERNALKLAEADINAHGGINGPSAADLRSSTTKARAIRPRSSRRA